MSSRKVTIPAVKVVRTDGRYSLSPPVGALDAFRELLRYAHEKRGGFISASYDLPRRPRSTGKGSQSAHFHGHVQSIAKDTGQPAEDVKKYLKQKAVDRGYPMLKNDDGTPCVDFWGFYQGISEADASVEDEIHLIEAAHQLASELDIILVEEQS